MPLVLIPETKNRISITVRATRCHIFHSHIVKDGCALAYLHIRFVQHFQNIVTTSSTLASYEMTVPLPTCVYGSCNTSKSSSLQYLRLLHHIWWLCPCLLAGTLGDRLIQLVQHLQKHHRLPISSTFTSYMMAVPTYLYHAPYLHTTLLLLPHSFSQYSQALLIDVFNAILRKWYYNGSKSRKDVLRVLW